MKNMQLLSLSIGALVLSFSSQGAFAACSDVSYNHLQSAADAAVQPKSGTGGFGLPMWVTMVDETGKVCHVVNTSPQDQNGRSDTSWLGSRVISAQKANTANAFSLDGFSISTANLYGLVQPGGSLYGLQHSNPVDATRAYAGSPSSYGTNGDPLKNKRIGGVNVFGGGLALYNGTKKVGAIGVSGDTSCTDHAVAWNIRATLGMNHVPGGFKSGNGGLGDEIEMVATVTPNTTQHPVCGGTNGNPTVGVYTAP